MSLHFRNIIVSFISVFKSWFTWDPSRRRGYQGGFEVILSNLLQYCSKIKDTCLDHETSEARERWKHISKSSVSLSPSLSLPKLDDANLSRSLRCLNPHARTKIARRRHATKYFAHSTDGTSALVLANFRGSTNFSFHTHIDFASILGILFRA